MAVRTLLIRLSNSIRRAGLAGVCVCLLSVVSFMAHAINTQQAHEIIRSQHHHLLGDGKDLVSLYFFGSQQHQQTETTIIGLERVGGDYLPVRWLLVFQNQRLLGWYHPVADFPKAFKDGQIHFPQGLAADVIQVTPTPQAQFEMRGAMVPFVEPHQVESPADFP